MHMNYDSGWHYKALRKDFFLGKNARKEITLVGMIE